MKEENVLHLVLKGKWYQMIKAGIKKAEYREYNEYWCRRIFRGDRVFKKVCFHNGYTNEKLYFNIISISFDFGKPEWGAEPKKPYIVIKFTDKWIIRYKKKECKTEAEAQRKRSAIKIANIIRSTKMSLWHIRTDKIADMYIDCFRNCFGVNIFDYE